MCRHKDAPSGALPKGGPYSDRSRTRPPQKLTVSQVNQVIGAHMRLARIRMGYSMQELSRLSGVPVHEVEMFEIGGSEDLPVLNSARIGFVLRDALGPMHLDAELFCRAANSESMPYSGDHQAGAEQTH